MAKKTFQIVFRLTVDASTDEHLQTPDAVASEIRSWLEGLHAAVHVISVVHADPAVDL